jgi:hypothetical protein
MLLGFKRKDIVFKGFLGTSIEFFHGHLCLKGTGSSAVKTPQILTEGEGDAVKIRNEGTN